MMDHKPWYEMKQPEDNKAGYPITNRGYHRRQSKKDPTALYGINRTREIKEAEHEATKAQLKLVTYFIELSHRDGNCFVNTDYKHLQDRLKELGG